VGKVEIFSDRLHRLRALRRKPIKQIAIDCDVSRQTVYTWFNNDVIPRSSKIALLANSLQTTVDYLINGDSEEGRSEIIAELRRIIPGMTTRKLGVLLILSRELISSESA